MAAAAGDDTYHPDMFAAALALGLISVAFILLLVFCRNALCCCACCACCACCRRRRNAKDTAAPPPPVAPATEVADGHGKKRTVVNVLGTEGAAVAPTTNPAHDAVISVASSGGGFVVYTEQYKV